MPKVKFTLDGTRGLIQELLSDDAQSELVTNNLDTSVYARKDYVDNAILNISGSGGGNISLTGSNIFGSSTSNTHQFTGSVILNNGITGSLLGTASFATNSDLLDGLNSNQFARLDSNNNFNGNQVISGTFTIASVGGNEGGQIDLGLAVNNQNLTGTVALDIHQNKFRIFETGGSNRGVNVDISNMSSSVGSNLVTSETISSIVSITSASYAAITPVSGTLYIIIG